MRKISGHSSKQRLPFFIKLIRVLHKSDSRTELLDFFSLVTHNDQDADGRAGGGWSGGSRRGWEANKNLGDDKNSGWFIA